MIRPAALFKVAIAGLSCGCLLMAGAAPPAGMPIAVQGAGPYYQITLPAAVYGLAENSDLSDLRVQNAAGQSIPFAWVRSDTVQHTAVAGTVPIFPLPLSNPAHPTDVALSFVIRANGSLEFVQRSTVAKEAGVDWLMDTSQVHGRLLQAHFVIPSDVHGLLAFRLEASDDLKNWRSLGGEEQLVRLAYEKQEVERLSVDLGGIQSRFLRLRWSDPARSTRLVKVTIDSVQDAEPQPAIEWSGDVAPDKCADDYCDYTVPYGAPVHSLKVQLSQGNTLAPVRFYSLWDADLAQRRPTHVVHNPLYALRHQQRKTLPDASPRELLLTDSVVYRLNYPEGEVISPAIQLSGGAYRHLRLKTTGPIGNLGAVPPKLSLAVPLRTLVFLGQGDRPYSVARADALGAGKIVAGGPVALGTLIPGYKPEVLAGFELGTVVLNTTEVALTPPVQNAASASEAATPNRRFWLWGALLAGLLLLAGMAWSLLSNLKKDGAKVQTPDA